MEDIFLIELKVKIQDSKLPKGEHLLPFPKLALTQPPQAPLPHLSWLNTEVTWGPSKLTRMEGQPGPPEAQGGGEAGLGEDLPPSASSRLPSDAFSPRRRGAAEAPGAELCLCYRKVSAGCGREVPRMEAGVRSTWRENSQRPAEPSALPAPPPPVPQPSESFIGM